MFKALKGLFLKSRTKGEDRKPYNPSEPDLYDIAAQVNSKPLPPKGLHSKSRHDGPIKDQIRKQK